jgi:hypothetical protein
VFPLPEGAKKDDLSYQIDTRHIKVGLINGETFLEGDLFGDVEMKKCAVTWKSIETQRYVVVVNAENQPHTTLTCMSFSLFKSEQSIVSHQVKAYVTLDFH